IRRADNHRFSCTVRPFMTDGTCVLMPTPSRTTSCVLQPTTSVPRISTRPFSCVRRYCPVRHLKNVLLPAPLGPIRQRSSRSCSEKFTAFTATTPPKRMVRTLDSTTALLLVPASSCPDDGAHGPVLRDGAYAEASGSTREPARARHRSECRAQRRSAAHRE